MYEYTINIAHIGTDFVSRHYARVAIPTGSTCEEARRIAHNFITRFPESDGYKVTMTAWGRVGNDVVIR
jgi:hypothetical protein